MSAEEAKTYGLIDEVITTQSTNSLVSKDQILTYSFAETTASGIKNSVGQASTFAMNVSNLATLY